MLKKLMILLLILILPTAALGETLYYGAGEHGEAEALAAVLSDALGWELSPESSGTEAWSRLMDQQDGFAIGTQQQLIEGMQGYTSDDPRQALQPVLPLAGNDLYLVCAAETAEAHGFCDLPGLQSYVSEHPYELMLMRTFSASNADYGAFRLLEALELDTDTFVDEADCVECLSQGDYLLVADTALALELAEEGHAVLGALTEERTKEYPALPCAAERGLPACAGTYYALFAPAGADVSAARQHIEAVLLDPAFLNTLETAHLSPLAEDHFSWQADIKHLVDYMTAEGLYFYENND